MHVDNCIRTYQTRFVFYTGACDMCIEIVSIKTIKTKDQTKDLVVVKNSKFSRIIEYG